MSYSLYRGYCHSCYDHGIVGGISLYHDLCAYRKHVEDTFGVIHEGLYWGKELEKDFGFVSWVIACHNIWMINVHSKDAAKYKFWGLDDLIIKDNQTNEHEYPISSEKNPFLFLFCLVDSIEPIKVLKNTEMFSKIDIVFDELNLELSIESLPTNLKKRYAKKISDINSWLTTVQPNDSNSAKYKIKL